MTSAFEGISAISLLFGIVMVLSFALLGRIMARKLGLPTAIGELLAGVLVGNLFYLWSYDLILLLREGASCADIARLALSGHSWDEAARRVMGPEASEAIIGLLRGPHGSDYLQVSQAVDLFSRYGLMFVMFYVGLGTYVIAELRGIDADSLRVAIIGAIAPMALGFVVVSLMISDTSHVEHIFIAATLGTTSIAVTTLTLARLSQKQSREGRLILGAGVMDNVLGLLMLAIASGIAVTGSAAFADIGRTTARASLFLICAFVLGPQFLKFMIWSLRRLDVVEAKLFVSFIMVTFLAGLASIVHLSPVVGAFAAGLLMHESYFQSWGDRLHARRSIKELFAPLEVIIVPTFFVLMGMQVKLELLLDWGILSIFAGVLSVAVLGKWVSGLGARGEVNRLAVGFGMMPRGEVGLAFAFIGKTLGAMDPVMFAVVVAMIVVTTVVTPLLLSLAMRGAAQAPE